MTLTVALSKGKLLLGTEVLFRRAKLPFPEGESRRLVVPFDGFRFLFVKDMDVPTYVEYGVADCGIAGRDVLLETGADVLEPLDLGFGRCRLVVAAPRAAAFDYRRAATIRIATKYPRVATAHFLERGISAEVVRVHGSVELAPGLGLADGSEMRSASPPRVGFGVGGASWSPFVCFGGSGASNSTPARASTT